MDISSKKNSLRKNWLKEGSKQSFQYIHNFNGLDFFKINGYSNFWNQTPTLKFTSLFADILSGLSSEGTELAFVIASNGFNISIYVGVSRIFGDSLRNALLASYPYIDVDAQDTDNIHSLLKGMAQYGGLITGIPTDKLKDNAKVRQIEKVIGGLYGEKWAYIVTAAGIDSHHAAVLLDATLNEMRVVSSKIKWSSDGQGASRDERVEHTDFIAQRYFEDLEVLAAKLQIGNDRGLWKCNTLYISPDQVVAGKLGRLLKSVFAGEESSPEPIRNIALGNIRGAVDRGFGLVNDRLASSMEYNFLTLLSANDLPYSIFSYRLQTILNSQDLAVFCQFPKEEVPGFFINNYVMFDIAERRRSINFSIGNVVYDGRVLDRNEYKLELGSLNRHALITGITGGGKTNTSKHLLSSLWCRHKKPFLVIESAKREYWELARLRGMDDLLLFTLGNEGKQSVKYRLNPFERIGDTPLQTHIDYLLSAFKASFELIAPLPYILETCVYEVYSDRGWDVIEDVNIWGRKDYPTLQDLYYKVDIVVDRLGYDSRIRSDINAALKTRISSLMIGGKGAMLNAEKSFPINQLLNSPVVLELEDIGDDDVKAFIIGIILVQLYEHRKSTSSNTKGLKHVLVIEEAHRLLANVSTSQSSETANPRGKAVEFFCNLLAEIRSYGQGIMISDQMPTKLAQDVLKNTNLKVTHRIVTKEDRDLIGNAMNMTPEQIDYISTFKTGYAAVYSEGDSRPKLVKIPLMVDEAPISRSAVIAEVNKKLLKAAGDIYRKKPAELACSFCTEKCKWKIPTGIAISSGEVGMRFVEGVADYVNKMQVCNGITLKSIIEQVEKKLKRPLSLNERLCIANRFLSGINISDSYKHEAVAEYIRLAKGGK